MGSILVIVQTSLPDERDQLIRSVFLKADAVAAEVAVAFADAFAVALLSIYIILTLIYSSSLLPALPSTADIGLAATFNCIYELAIWSL